MENFSNNTQNIDIEMLIKFIESLKKEGRVWNDAEFCQKCGFPRSYLSDMKAGRKALSEQIILKIRRSFPDFGGETKSVPIRPEELTLDEIHRSLIDHDVRFHDTVNRILDAMGVSNKKVANE